MMSAIANARVRMKSAEELLAVAAALEREAAMRYRELAARMARQRDAAMAEQFEALAAMEDRHARDISERGEKVLGHSPAQLGAGWELPVGYDEDEARGATLSVYQAIAFAVRNEERAFVYFTYVAAETDDTQIRALAEDLARDELMHLSILRGHRRRAFHADRPEPFALPINADELRASAMDWDAATAIEHNALAEMLGHTGDTETAEVFRRLAARETPVAGSIPNGITTLRTPADGLRILEDRFDRYARIGERSDDEDIVREAQRLAAEMITRLALVGGTLSNGLLHAPTL